MTGTPPAAEQGEAPAPPAAGTPIPPHHGDAGAEYRAVREAVGIVARNDLAVLRMWGRDPVKMLQGLITNDIAGASPGKGVYAAMLTPKGRMIADLRAFRLGAAAAPEIWMVVSREALPGTTEHLKKFVPPLFARWSDASGELAVTGLYGPRSRELASLVLHTDLPSLPEDGFVEVSYGGNPALIARTTDAGGEDGYDIITTAAGASTLREELLSSGAVFGARQVGWDALETLRIEAGRPRYGAELTDDIIPTEAFETAGLMDRGISFTKGCYTGQEVIVRIAHRGHVNRHLRGLLLGNVPPPKPGTPCLHPDSGKQVGWITSAAVSPLAGQTAALGFVRREIGLGGTVRVGAAEGSDAAVVGLPLRAGE